MKWYFGSCDGSIWVMPSHSSGAHWRTERRHVKLVVTQTAFSQTIERRHIDRTTKGARLSEAHIVEQYDEYVWGSFGCFDLESRWRRCIPRVKFLCFWIFRFRDRQNRAVQ